MILRGSRLSILLALILGVCIVAGCDQGEGPDPFVGKPAPDASLISAKPEDQGKEPITISGLKGHVVLLEFWATWCGPCQSVMPDVETLYDKYKDQGLEVVAVSNEFMSVIQEFRHHSPYTYPAFQDASGAASTSFQADSIPDTFVIDRSGVVRFHEVGADPDGVKKAVESAMSGKADPGAGV